MEASHSGKENKRKRRGGKIMIKGKEEEEKKAYSLPSLRERSETPEAFDRHDWESQEANLLPRTILSASVHITSYWRSGCRRGHQESIAMCTELAQPPTRLLGRQMFRTPVCKQTRHLDFRQNCFQIQYLNPSRLKRVACAMAS